MAYASLLVLLAGLVTVQAACQGNFVEFKGKCFKVHPQLANWVDAIIYCAEMRGTLASITSAEEQDFITGLIRSDPLLSGTRFWIGAAALEVKKKYRWIDGSDWKYTNWAPDEPNNSSDQEDCAQIYDSGPSFMWNDISCTAKCGFICSSKA